MGDKVQGTVGGETETVQREGSNDGSSGYAAFAQGTDTKGPSQQETDRTLSSSTNIRQQKGQEELPNIAQAANCFDNFDYAGGLEICLKLLRHNYDDAEAHVLISETFHALGFKNELVLKVKEELKQVMLESLSGVTNKAGIEEK